MVFDYGVGYCKIHPDAEFTSECICPGCYDEMQFGDDLMADADE